MKAARYHGPQDVRIENVPEPRQLQSDEVLLHILAASICGTDASQYLHPTMIPLHQAHPVSGHCGPVTLGHEVVGRVIEKGSAVVGLQIGDRVVPGSGWWCGECPSCLAGRINICERYYLYGVQRDGGLAEQAIFPAKMCIRVPSDCSDAAAALAQPTAVALHALSRLQLEAGASLALFGTGNIGSLLLAVLQAQGIAVSPLIAIDIEPSRLAAAQRLGATHLINAKDHSDPVARIRTLTQDHGVHRAIEATGIPSLINQALTVVCRGGILLQVGIPTQPVTLSFDQMVVQEKTVMTTNGQICLYDLPQALELLTHTDVAARLHTYEIPFDRFVEDGLLPLVTHDAPGKVIITL